MSCGAAILEDGISIAIPCPTIFCDIKKIIMIFFFGNAMKKICRDEFEAILECFLGFDDGLSLLESAAKFKEMREKKYGKRELQKPQKVNKHDETIKKFFEKIKKFEPSIVDTNEGDNYKVFIIKLAAEKTPKDFEKKDYQKKYDHQKPIFKEILKYAKECDVYLKRLWHHGDAAHICIITSFEGTHYSNKLDDKINKKHFLDDRLSNSAKINRNGGVGGTTKESRAHRRKIDAIDRGKGDF